MHPFGPPKLSAKRKMGSSPPPASQAIESRRPRSAHTVAVNIAEDTQNSGHRFQLELSECVETKTVTTTTRLTRKFPRVFANDPTPLESLDTKEYPLAMKPTPPELLGFSYNMHGQDEDEYAQDNGGTRIKRAASERPASSHRRAKSVSCTMGDAKHCRPRKRGLRPRTSSRIANLCFFRCSAAMTEP